jgi:hypothetical protein
VRARALAKSQTATLLRKSSIAARKFPTEASTEFDAVSNYGDIPPRKRGGPAEHARLQEIAHGKLGKQLRTVRARVAQLFEQRGNLPKRIEVRDPQRASHGQARHRA